MRNSFEAQIFNIYGDKNAEEIYVRGSAKSIVDWFGNDVDCFTIGKSLGEQSHRGANNSWPVYMDGERVGSLYDDATGLTFQAMPDDAIIEFSLFDTDELIEKTIEFFNCKNVEVKIGGVWVEGPGRGLWLDDRKLAELLDFVQDAKGK
jgi:hypothetical protein